jgi:hypothetical protein
MQRVARLQMVTPFRSDVAGLDEDEQVVMLKGCALCRITRDLDAGTTRSKSEWKTCKTELGVPIDVFPVDGAPAELLRLVSEPPAVCALTDAGTRIVLLDADALDRCRGSVADFRGRLAYRLAMLDLTIDR